MDQALQVYKVFSMAFTAVVIVVGLGSVFWGSDTVELKVGGRESINSNTGTLSELTYHYVCVDDSEGSPGAVVDVWRTKDNETHTSEPWMTPGECRRYTSHRGIRIRVYPSPDKDATAKVSYKTDIVAWILNTV